jgi:hypothetical protein
MKLINSRFSKALPLSLLLVPLLLLPAATASSPPPMKGSGTFNVVVATDTTLYSYGGYTIYYITGPTVLTGTETGNATIEFSLLVYPSGHDVAQGSYTCESCMVNGVAGSFMAQFVSQGTYGGPSAGHNVQTGTSGGLVGFHGIASFQSFTTETGFAGPYQLVYTLGQ